MGKMNKWLVIRFKSNLRLMIELNCSVCQVTHLHLCSSRTVSIHILTGDDTVVVFFYNLLLSYSCACVINCS
jgi:hypothetical protein